MSNLKQELVSQGVNAVPSALILWCTAIMSITLNQWTAIAGIGYIVLQGAYLIWKWVREARAPK